MTDSPHVFLNHVFVYGTLKEGFCNADKNPGVRVPGKFVTVERYPLYLLKPELYPWLVDLPGEGSRVRGQLFAVDDAGLALLDQFEGVDQPGWYHRRTIEVQALNEPDAALITAECYLGDEQQVGSKGIQSGPLVEYTLADDRMGCDARRTL